MVTRNDYVIRLFNGDVGIVFPDLADSNNQRVYFPSAESSFRKILPLQLPEHETAYAMTVHKSQGSEFDRVLLLLPDRESPVLSRELFYTAITRARKRVEVWGTENIIRFMINNPIRRTSGLRDALWLR
jgi:exodeoxyribonuclease V alpha subunit